MIPAVYHLSAAVGSDGVACNIIIVNGLLCIAAVAGLIRE